MGGNLGFSFADSISEMCGTIGEKSWTAREHRPERIPVHLRKAHSKRARFLVKESI